MHEIKHFLENEDLDTLEIPMRPLRDVLESFESIGYKEVQPYLEINGWQCDFWMYLSKDTSKVELVITGSLYYGRFQIEKIKEQTN